MMNINHRAEIEPFVIDDRSVSLFACYFPSYRVLRCWAPLRLNCRKGNHNEIPSLSLHLIDEAQS